MFRFTIRDVLWLTALVAMAVGWWAYSRRAAAHQAATVAHAESLRTQLKIARGYVHLVRSEGRGPIYGDIPISANPPDWKWIEKPIP
jgi:hypothetical protein